MVKRYEFWNCFGKVTPNDNELSEEGEFVSYSDYAALEARVAELEKDAARYRWARMQGNREVAAILLTNRMNADDAFDEAMSCEA